MKSKLIDSGFNDHFAWVKIQTKEGEFEGTAHTHPEDYDIESEFAGCGYAERRAEIKAMKMKARLLKERYKAYKSLIEDVNTRNKFNLYGYEYQVILEYVRRTYKEYCDLKEQIKVVQDKLNADMDNRRQHMEEVLDKQKRRKPIKWVDLGEIDLSHLKKNEK